MIGERHEEHVTWLTFENPDRLNAFNGFDYRDLRQAIRRALDDEDTRVIVLTGRGRSFSAGADRSLIDQSATEEQRAIANEEFPQFLAVLRVCEKPLLAAVNGFAIGIGCTMLLYCDLVIAAQSARFRMPFTALGIVPEAGSSALLPAQGRWPDVMWAALSSEWIDADTAREMGIAWRVVPDSVLLEETARVAAAIAELEPGAVTATKRLLTAGRAELARAAIDREFAELRMLRRGGR